MSKGAGTANPSVIGPPKNCTNTISSKVKSLDCKTHLWRPLARFASVLWTRVGAQTATSQTFFSCLKINTASQHLNSLTGAAILLLGLVFSVLTIPSADRVMVHGCKHILPHLARFVSFAGTSQGPRPMSCGCSYSCSTAFSRLENPHSTIISNDVYNFTRQCSAASAVPVLCVLDVDNCKC